jgi:SAM-dependent methyltransferase
MDPKFTPEYQRIACPVCRGTETAAWRRLRGETTSRCRSCGHVFADPMPTEQTMIAAYGLAEADYIRFFKCEYLDLKALHQNTQQWQVANALQWVEKANALVPEKGRVLELGCSSGFFLEAARDSGWETAGVDPALLSRRSADIDRALGIQRTDLFSAKLDDGSFDLVLAASVVEHLVDPRRYLQKLTALLKPGGHILILGLPNVRSLTIRIGIDRYIGNHPPIHLQYFSRQSVTRLLEDAGLHDVAVRSYGLSETILELLFNRGSAKYSGDYTNLLNRGTAGSRLLGAARNLVYSMLDRLDLGSVMEVSAAKG